MTLPDLAASRCAHVSLQVPMAVPEEVIASIGKGKLKRGRQVIGDLSYGTPPGRVHMLASIRKRRDQASLLEVWLHIDPTPQARPRPTAETRASEAFQMALDRLGEGAPDEVSIDINATFVFPASEYSPAIELPSISLSEGTSLKVLGLRLGIGDAAPGSSSIILDVGSTPDILVAPTLKVPARVSAALPRFVVESARAVAEKFVIRKG